MHTWGKANDRFLHLLSCEGNITGSTPKIDRTHQGPIQLLFLSPYVVIFFPPLCFNSLAGFVQSNPWNTTLVGGRRCTGLWSGQEVVAGGHCEKDDAQLFMYDYAECPCFQR